MNTIVIVLCAVLAVAYGSEHVDNYIRINRDQYKRVLDGYDTQLAQFREHYEGRVKAIAVQKELVIASIVQTEERITPLLLLSGPTKQCVLKYRGRVASVEATKAAITSCQVVATTKFSKLLTAAVNVRNALLHNNEQYAQEVAACKHENYTSCVTTLTSKANKFTFENQKSFEYELEAAECLAKANVKEVVDCVYTVKFDLLTELGQFEALLGKCLDGDDDCTPCEKYTCKEAANVYGKYEDHTVANPLYGRTDKPTCLLLNVH